MRKLFHFFGRIHFAICLIATTALFVIAGTFIESWADSHQYAASLTYEHPAFLVLLGFFFINILFSALRRWPFQKKHIPFLITHLGLLMIILGVVIKTIYGVQGVMTLVEGSGSNSLLVPHTHALRVEDRDHKVSYFQPKERKAPFQLMGYAPHSTESYEYWIKGNQAVIQGLPPFPVYSWEKGRVPISAQAHFTPNETWDLVALKVDDVEKAAQELFQQGLEQGIAHLDFHLVEGFRNPIVKIKDTAIPLMGNQSLMNDQGIDLNQTPTLAFIQDKTGNTHLFFFGRHGRVFHQLFKSDQYSTLAVYDEGFSGYNIMVDIPYYSQSRKDIEDIFLENLKTELDAADPTLLAPPLQFIYETCGDKYSECVIDLFRHWNQVNMADIPSLNWNSVDENIRRGIEWASHYLQTGGTVEQWPLPLDESKEDTQIPQLIQQIISINDQLPEISFKDDPYLLKTYLLAYGIHPSAISPPYDILQIEPQTHSIECPLSLRQRTSTPTKKIESHHPIVTIQFDEEDPLSLSYDSTGSGLCWPAAGGKYLVRFQPLLSEIPYHVRLRNARQITYANSGQPFSYEADLLIEGEEVTLSMNHVHETWDGYRFYLSSISPPNETQVKRIQLIINRDPAKYFLTYPGGILVSIGILLLFWWSPRQKKTGEKRSG